MQMTIESTEMVTHLDGVKCRVWKGVTPEGVDCHVFVHRIAVQAEADASSLESELQEQLPPGRVVPLAHVLV
jgi:hypothetical protein